MFLGSFSRSLKVVTLWCLLNIVGYGGVHASTAIAYGSFVKSATYSIANQLGYFADEGLNVTYHQVPNSSFAYDGLFYGTYDILTGTIDNAINLVFNAKAGLTVLGQLDQGSDIVLAATSAMATVQDLRGKPIMVDGELSGYSYVLRRLLSFYGLQYGTDYSFQIVGGTPFRYQALLHGHLNNGSVVYATVLTYPYTAYLAREANTSASPAPHVLARVSDFVAPFSSQALTVRTSTVTHTSNPAYRATVSFVRAMLRANRLLADPDPQRRAELQGAIAAELGIEDEATAALELAAATDAVTGETAQVDFQVSGVGLWNVIGIRDRFGGFTAAGPGFDFVEALPDLIDYRVRDAARHGIQ
ncbi:hypothetical protein PG991_003353 [Apiospora marii]|uniref:SsuA/THI5-like domain-containing protein n=2 Tax=Apiospora marii TaxID=335849 RepID=A0ABR1SHZ5_9PEZI